MAVLHVNKENFEKLLASPTPVLVDFWAGWCGPCKMLAPVIEKLAQDYEGRLTVAKVDVDAEQDLAIQYGVMNIPTVVLFSGGQEVERLVGVRPQSDFDLALERHL